MHLGNFTSLDISCVYVYIYIYVDMSWMHICMYVRVYVYIFFNLCTYVLARTSLYIVLIQKVVVAYIFWIYIYAHTIFSERQPDIHL